MSVCLCVCTCNDHFGGAWSCSIGTATHTQTQNGLFFTGRQVFTLFNFLTSRRYLVLICIVRHLHFSGLASETNGLSRFQWEVYGLQLLNSRNNVLTGKCEKMQAGRQTQTKVPSSSVLKFHQSFSSSSLCWRGLTASCEQRQCFGNNPWHPIDVTLGEPQTLPVEM